MKKLLSLLSVLTISGSAVPTTIAASPYQKEETKLENNKINYQQTNNLENLKRDKRENNNFPHKDAPNLNISGSVSDYHKSLCEIIIYLRTNDIIREIRGDAMYDPSEQPSTSTARPVSCGIDINFNPRERYFINRNSNYNYFIIPFVIENETNQQSNIVRMIYRTRDFYLLGFIVNGNYYYFANADDIKDIREYKNNRQKLDDELKKNVNLRHPEIKILNFSNNHHNLMYSGDYNSLTRAAINNDENRNFGNPQITWEGISDSFFQISNMGTNHQPSNDILAASLIRIILATSESMRFNNVRDSIINSVSRRNFEGIPVYWNNFIETIKNWKKLTKEAINYLLENGNLFNYYRINHYNIIADVAILADIMSDYFKSCNNKKPRDSNNNNEYCVYLHEKKLYYNDYKSSNEITYDWYNNNFYHNTLVKTFDLGKINPVDYFTKIEFLGKEDDFKKTRVSWGDEPYHPDYYLNHFNGISISQYIKNKKINGDYNSNEIPDYFKITLQPYARRRWYSAWIDIYQGIGITFYWENDNWYLQLLASQYGHSIGSTYGGSCFINLGSGIRLYND